MSDPLKLGWSSGPTPWQPFYRLSNRTMYRTGHYLEVFRIQNSVWCLSGFVLFGPEPETSRPWGEHKRSDGGGTTLPKGRARRSEDKQDVQPAWFRRVLPTWLVCEWIESRDCSRRRDRWATVHMAEHEPRVRWWRNQNRDTALRSYSTFKLQISFGQLFNFPSDP